MTHVGIDPGLTGAIAFINPYGVASVADLPTLVVPGDGYVKKRIDGRGLFELVRSSTERGQPMRVFCEEVNAMGSQNKAIQTQAALLATMRAIEAVFDIIGAPCQLVLPQRWQGFYGLQGKKAEDRARGALPQALLKCHDLYPDSREFLSLVGHHNKAEALLIAHWGRRHFP